MARFLALAAFLFAAIAASPHAAWADEEPRVVIVLHDGGAAATPLVEAAPALRHLGLIVEAHDAADPLPELADRRDVRGVLIWLDDGAVGDAAGFTSWLRGVTRAGLPVVLMGRTPEVEDRFGLFLALDLIYSRDERAYNYDLRAIEKDPALIETGRRFDNLFPLADIVRPLVPETARPLLVLQRRNDSTDRTMPLIVTAKGAYAAEGYALWRSTDGRAAQWRIDPAAWFRLSFGLETVPVPDTATLNARRLFVLGLAPATASDREAAIATADTLAATRPERPISVMLDALPADPQDACDDRFRAMVFGYDSLFARLDAGEVPHRTSAYAPVLPVCAGDRSASLAAAQAVLDHARTLPLAAVARPLDEIDAGFATARLERTGTGTWQVLDRGALQTLRFDDADHLRLDWTRSDGVLGAGRVNGALYISLDPDAATPVVAVTNLPWELPPFATLVESRWAVSGLVRDIETAAMDVQGYGPGDMVWSVEPYSEWELRFTPKGGATLRYRAVVGDDGLLAFALPAKAAEGGTLAFERQDFAEVGP